jgi:hypothetical protein
MLGQVHAVCNGDPPKVAITTVVAPIVCNNLVADLYILGRQEKLLPNIKDLDRA